VRVFITQHARAALGRCARSIFYQNPKLKHRVMNPKQFSFERREDGFF
jgi:type IV secretory pathway VirB4 component